MYYNLFREHILADNELSEVLLRGVEIREEPSWLDGTKEYFTKWSSNMQIRLLAALDKTKSPDLKAFVIQGLESSSSEVRQKARSLAGKAGVPNLQLLISTLSDSKPSGQGEAIKQLAELKSPEAKNKFMEFVADYKSGKIPSHWKLEMWEAAKSQGISVKGGYDLLEVGGDPKKGEKLVMTHAAAQCNRCHKINDSGSALGPDLTKIGRLRNRAHLVVSMLDPLREITDGYGNIIANMKNGDEITGVLSSQKPDEWLVTQADGKTIKINPKEIEKSQLTSIMPPMSGIMKPEEIRDVVSYLATLK